MRLVENWMCAGWALPTFSFLFLFFFCEHGAVDPDDIPFMPTLYLILFLYFSHYPCFNAKRVLSLNPNFSYSGSAIKLLLLFAVIIFPYTYVYKDIHMYVKKKTKNCIWVSIYCVLCVDPLDELSN